MNRSSRRRRTHSVVLLNLFLAAVLVSGCGPDLSGLIRGINDTSTQTVGILDDAIGLLAKANADWQVVLQDTIAKLTDSAQSTVRNEISDLLSRGIATTGAEFRCDADFLRNRMRQALIRIRAQILNVPVEDVEPSLCQVVPLAVDVSLLPNRLNKLEIFGYDFDTVPIQVILQNTSGTVDVSSKLQRPTHYHMTLNLGGNGVPITAQSQKLTLRWKDREISTIAVIQPATPVCKTEIINVPINALSYLPPKTRGDREFDGNGPRVSAVVTLAPSAERIDTRVQMSARETEADYTTASGSRSFLIYTSDPGWRIDRVVGGLSSDFAYIDNDHELDGFAGSAGGPVSRWEFHGDGPGDDAGVTTDVKVFFNTLRIQRTESKNCVSPTQIQSAKAANLLSDSVLTRFGNNMLNLDPEILAPVRP